MVEVYQTIREPLVVELVIKKSRFIGACFPVNDVETAEEIIRRVSKEHYKATHNTFAYVLSPDGSVFRYSDDGEPSLTAGKPMYDTIVGMGLTDVLVMVTRYFGGVKLGTGGLTRAYAQSAREALEAAAVKVMKRYRLLTMVCDYNMVGSLQHFLLKYDHQLGEILYLEQVTFSVYVAAGEVEAFVEGYRELTNGQEPQKGEEVYRESNE